MIAPVSVNAGRVLLVSDLHLSEERPKTNRRFFRFLRDEVEGAAALYVLGDLFESWIGDDDLDPLAGGAFNREIVAALAEVPRRGTLLFLMRGNRDFLMGERLCLEAGASLLEDPAVADIGGVRTLLMHGDTLCTDDVDYQAWRATARSKSWQEEFLSRPLAERRAIARDLRDRSRAMTRSKAPEIMDVNEAAVHEALQDANVQRLIHGHTHRPATHRLQVGGAHCERWVLPDWYGTGGYLEISDGMPRLIRFAERAD